jgi:DNA-binding transcriptional MerR regulator
MRTYQIAQVADMVGVPATTLRYYEDAGVVTGPPRGDNGYRAYNDRDVDRLRFVARARRLDLGVDELRDLVALWDTDDHSTVQHRMAEMVATRAADAQRQIADLVALAGQLQTVAARLEGTAAAGPCGDDCPCLSTASPDASRLVTLGRPLPHNEHSVTTPVACSLEPDAVPGRVNDWRRTVARATSRTVIDGGVALHFPADPDVAGELARLAAAEQQCCAFFDFRITIAGPAIVFEVRAPADAHDVVTAMFGAAA